MSFMRFTDILIAALFILGIVTSVLAFAAIVYAAIRMFSPLLVA